MLADKLIQLSKIFKNGFTVELKNGELNQYSNINKPYIVSYLTIITLTNNKVVYKGIEHLINNCIIGGWFDNETNIYFIELNKVFQFKEDALIFAKKHNQKAIYNIKTGKTINTCKGDEI